MTKTLDPEVERLLRKRLALKAQPYPHDKEAMRQVNRELARKGVYQPQHRGALEALLQSRSQPR